MASSCMVCDLIEELPCGAGILRGDLLNRIAQVNQHMVAHGYRKSVQHEQAHFALDSPGFAGCLEALDGFDLHRQRQAHRVNPVFKNGRYSDPHSIPDCDNESSVQLPRPAVRAGWQYLTGSKGVAGPPHEKDFSAWYWQRLAER